MSTQIKKNGNWFMRSYATNITTTGAANASSSPVWHDAAEIVEHLYFSAVRII